MRLTGQTWTLQSARDALTARDKQYERDREAMQKRHKAERKALAAVFHNDTKALGAAIDVLVREADEQEEAKATAE